MDISLGKIKICLNPEKIKKTCVDFLISWNRWIIISLAILLAGYFCYVWYFFIFNPSWDENRKAEYINQNMKNATLNSKKYDAVVSRIEEREKASEGEEEEIKDIFRLKW